MEPQPEESDERVPESNLDLPLERIGLLFATGGPGYFIKYGTGWTFVEGLERVEEEVAKLVRGAPARAAALYEAWSDLPEPDLQGPQLKEPDLMRRGLSYGSPP